jgi:hypothetical protein
MRYEDLVRESDRVRSTAWFHKLLNSDDPWAVSPPSRADAEAFSKVIGRGSPDFVMALIAEEWFGIVRSEDTARVRGIAGQLDALSDADFRLVQQMVTRLLA